MLQTRLLMHYAKLLTRLLMMLQMKGRKFSNATAMTPNSRAPVTLQILYAVLMNIHSVMRKPDDNKRRSDSPRKVCLPCGKILDRNCDLEKHMVEEHNTTKEIKCETCNKAFVLEWGLRKHLQIHVVEPKPCCYFLKRKKWYASFRTM